MNIDALIRTKFQRPAIGPDILPRTRLLERLENGRHRKLILISAPASYLALELETAEMRAWRAPNDFFACLFWYNVS